MEGIVSTQLGSRYRIGRRPHGLVARGLEARVIWKPKKRGVLQAISAFQAGMSYDEVSPLYMYGRDATRIFNNR
jgi:hypothetical protein